MEIDIILKIAGLGVITAVINQVLKHFGKEEIATFTTLACIIIVIFIMLNLVTDMLSQIKNIFGLF